MEILLSGLKARRKAAGLTQQQLAAAADVSVATIFKHEQGAINGVDGNTLDALCGALGCQRYELFLPPNSDVPEKDLSADFGRQMA